MAVLVPAVFWNKANVFNRGSTHSRRSTRTYEPIRQSSLEVEASVAPWACSLIGDGRSPATLRSSSRFPLLYWKASFHRATRKHNHFIFIRNTTRIYRTTNAAPYRHSSSRFRQPWPQPTRFPYSLISTVAYLNNHLAFEPSNDSILLMCYATLSTVYNLCGEHLGRWRLSGPQTCH